jgi:dTDP-4-amino-4,6-dideoxygalactose transaminase
MTLPIWPEMTSEQVEQVSLTLFQTIAEVP